MVNLKIGETFERIIEWLQANVGGLFDAISAGLTALIGAFETLFLVPPFYVVIVVLAGLAWLSAGWPVALFTAVGLFLVWGMGFWASTGETLALVLTSATVALALGIPLGIWAARNRGVSIVVVQSSTSCRPCRRSSTSSLLCCSSG
jgi:glycine betaine/proline transport system permease protein